MTFETGLSYQCLLLSPLIQPFAPSAGLLTADTVRLELLWASVGSRGRDDPRLRSDSFRR